MEPNSDPYPNILLIDQLQLVATDQLLFYIFSILFFTIIIGLMTASNTAFGAINPTDIADLKKSEDKKDELLLKLLDKPASLQATITITYTLLSVFIIVTSTLLLSELFFFEKHISLVILAYSSIITIFLLFTSVYFPKVFAAKHYLDFARWMIYPMIALQWILRPLIALLVFTTKAINQLVKPRYRFSDEEFNRMNDSDLINEENEDEQMILKGIANFSNISVKQIMRSRMDVMAIDIETDYDTVLKKINETRYSRIPVYEKNLDTIRGILFVKDILIHIHEKDFKWQQLVRPAYFVPENKKIDDLLKEFKSRHIHIAIVVDEYGGTSGIVTLEDILEEIVGDISDEYDEADDELRYSKLDDNNYVFDGKTPLNDILKLLSLDENTFDEVRGEADTIGGLVLAIAGRFLFINEKVSYQNFIFTVESADRRRIKRVKVTILEEEDE